MVTRSGDGEAAAKAAQGGGVAARVTLKETRIDKEKRNICYRPVRGVYVCKQAWFMVHGIVAPSAVQRLGAHVAPGLST